jgi:hypothetical protein
MRKRVWVALAAAAAALLADGLSAGWFDRVPLTDMVGPYKGFAGKLYPGSNLMPADHAAAGAAHAAAIVPRNVAGQPDAAGKYVLLSIGMSNTTQEFCSGSSTLPCDPFTFMGQAAADPQVNRTTLVIANGAQGGKTADFWDSATHPDYARVRDTVLAPHRGEPPAGARRRHSGQAGYRLLKMPPPGVGAGMRYMICTRKSACSSVKSVSERLSVTRNS